MAIALITGASSGIGLELARVFAGDGVDVILSARSEDKMQGAGRRSAGEVWCKKPEVIVADLSVPGEAEKVYDRVAEMGWNVDYLVNNAGFGVYGFYAETDWLVESDMLKVNIVALTHLTKLFLPGCDR